MFGLVAFAQVPFSALVAAEIFGSASITSDATEIVAEKQRLRDITKLVDSARTVDQLKNITVN
jgi:hypothetical protein